MLRSDSKSSDKCMSDVVVSLKFLGSEPRKINLAKVDSKSSDECISNVCESSVEDTAVVITQ